VYRLFNSVCLAYTSCYALGVYYSKHLVKNLSQGARQGLALLMASAVVVLKHETSTLRQRHTFISIDFKFGVGDYVREVTNPDKVGSGPMSDGSNIYGYFDFLYSSTELNPYP